MLTFVTVVFVVICIILVVLVLLQQSQGGLGTLGGNAQTMMGPSKGNALSSATGFFAVLFFTGAIFLSIIHSGGETTVFDKSPDKINQTVPAAGQGVQETNEDVFDPESILREDENDVTDEEKSETPGETELDIDLSDSSDSSNEGDTK